MAVRHNGRRRVYCGIVRDFVMFRYRHNLSQEDVARIFQVRQTTVSRWESGATLPPNQVANKMMDILENFVTQEC